MEGIGGKVASGWAYLRETKPEGKAKEDNNVKFNVVRARKKNKFLEKNRFLSFPVIFSMENKLTKRIARSPVSIVGIVSICSRQLALMIIFI